MLSSRPRTGDDEDDWWCWSQGTSSIAGRGKTGLALRGLDPASDADAVTAEGVVRVSLCDR